MYLCMYLYLCMYFCAYVCCVFVRMYVVYLCIYVFLHVLATYLWWRCRGRYEHVCAFESIRVCILCIRACVSDKPVVVVHEHVRALDLMCMYFVYLCMC